LNLQEVEDVPSGISTAATIAPDASQPSRFRASVIFLVNSFSVQINGRQGGIGGVIG